MRIALLFLLLPFTHVVLAQEPDIIPRPVEIKSPAQPGKFMITTSTSIVLQGAGLEQSADFLKDYLRTYHGVNLSVVKNAKTKNAILLNYERTNKAIPGGYKLEVKSGSIKISGDNEEGVFYGIQTLIQLLPVAPNKMAGAPVSFVQITDYPRFSYRGLHLDVCRHFFPVSYLKKYIDYIALHKMNYFHWHLTDDQGWRIEIKKYPLLTEVGATRHGTIVGRYPGKTNDSIRYGGFYTQDEIRDVVKYAAARYITVIPEIELPGHASAAIAAYPKLSCFPEERTLPPAKSPWWSGDTTGKQLQQTWGVFPDVFCPSDYTFQFLEGVLDEVVELFPAKYIHIGGDECPKDNWKRSEFCQNLIKERGLKDEHGLQSYFIQRMEKYLNGKGKQIIGWDEILEGGLAPNATVMSWRGEQGGITAASQDHYVIMTPSSHLYFDHKQQTKEDSVTIGNYTPVEKIYGYEPISVKLPEGKEQFILGAQANLWTEYIGNTRKLEYMLFPRMAALSEMLWSPKDKRNFANFEKRLPSQLKRYKRWNINYNAVLK
ncbi:MAG: beta-N-acetylhexosaminidase [Chitinophagaceae bacterium]|nr:beta-N-acetylhexosaminidase [Chitinophagaceae bacterium]